MRRAPATPNGLIEFTVAETVAGLRSLGIEELSLNFAVLGRYLREGTGWRREALRRVLRVGDRFFQLGSLYRFNDKFFPRFQRNNFEFGMSFEVPILTGRSGSAASVQAQVDIDKIRAEIGRTRVRITADLQHAYREVRRVESAQKLARADLDLTREQLTLDLTRYDEGQVTMAQVEASRAAEQEKWIAYYDAQHTLEVARLTILRQTGTLVAALRQ